MAKDTSKANYSRYEYKMRFHEKPVYHYFLILLVVTTLVISAVALANTYKLKKAVAPKIVSVNEFLKKLTTHAEMKSYVGIAPLNIVQINNDNYANLQAQISSLDISYLGNYIVQYTDRIVVYDFENDRLRGNVGLQKSQAKLPDDFFAKLNKHAELQGFQNEQPVGGQIDAASLSTLRQQFPDVYANAKVGDFLMRYKTKLIIYDYADDKIVNTVNLS